MPRRSAVWRPFCGRPWNEGIQSTRICRIDRDGDRHGRRKALVGVRRRDQTGSVSHTLQQRHDASSFLPPPGASRRGIHGRNAEEIHHSGSTELVLPSGSFSLSDSLENQIDGNQSTCGFDEIARLCIENQKGVDSSDPMISESVFAQDESQRAQIPDDRFTGGGITGKKWLRGDDSNSARLRSQSVDYPRKPERVLREVNALQILGGRSESATAPSAAVGSRKGRLEDLNAVGPNLVFGPDEIG